MNLRICIILCFLFSQSIRAETGPIRIVSHSAADNRIIVDVESDEPQFKDAIPDIQENIYVRVIGENLLVEELVKKVSEKSTSKPLLHVVDIPIGASVNSAGIINDEIKRTRYWEKSLVQTSGNTSIFRITIFPFQYNASVRKLKWLKQLSLNIQGNGIEQIDREQLIRETVMAPLPEKNVREPSSVKSSFSPSFEKTDHNGKRLKIWINREGICRLPQPMIVKAGWDIANVPARNLKVVNSEGEVPIRIIGGEDGSLDFYDVIEFWAEPIWDKRSQDGYRIDVYSNNNVYWLEAGNTDGLRMVQEVGILTGNASEAYSYPYTQHEEKDSYFDRLANIEDVDEADLWNYGQGIAGGEKRGFSFVVNGPYIYATQLASVRLRMRGMSSSLLTHPYEIYVNSRRVYSGTWTRNERLVVNTEGFSPTFIHNGTNEIFIINRSDEQRSSLLVDWFEITYPRLYEPHNDYLRFKPPVYSSGKTVRFEMEGFTTNQIELYKKNTSHFIGCEIEAITDTLDNTTYTLSFEDRVIDEGVEYIVTSQTQKFTPDTVLLVENNRLQSEGTGADYLILAPADSLGEEALTDLIQLREEQGLSTKVVLLDEIYDSFNMGIPHPGAIRRFLRYAVQSWHPAPQYALFIGDGYFNHREQGENVSLFPIVHYQTYQYGATPSDHWYSLMDDEDFLSDISVGRLPVRDTVQLQTIVQKIVDYERYSNGFWRNRCLMIASGAENDIFRKQSESLIGEVLDASFHPDRLYLTGAYNDPYIGGTDDLLRYFEDGVAMINFRGHGGGGIWSDADLLNLDDIKLIENKGKLPIITSMTCYTCDFSTSRSSLGEALVCENETGAIAMLGSTGYGWTFYDHYLIQYFYAAVSSQSASRLGDLIDLSKKTFAENHFGDLPTSQVYQQTLIGDPALTLTLPFNKAEILMNNQSLENQELLEISGQSENNMTHLRLEVAKQDLAEFESYDYELSEPDWNVTLQLPPDFPDASGGIRAYLYHPDHNGHERGYVPFVIGRSFIDSIRTIPPKPTYKDSIRFAAYIEDPAGLESVYCTVLTPEPDSLVLHHQGNSVYTSEETIGPLDPDEILSFIISARTSEGYQTNSDTITVYFPSLPDLRPHTYSVEGENNVFIVSRIKNVGETDVNEVIVRFRIPECNFVDQDTVAVEGGRIAPARVPLHSAIGNVEIQIEIDPDSLIFETKKENNNLTTNITVNQFRISPEFGSQIYYSRSDTVGIPGEMLCYVQPGSVSETNTVRVQKIIVPDYYYPEYVLENFQTTYSFLLTGQSGNQQLQKEALFFITPDNNEDLNVFKPYKWQDQVNNWVLTSFSLEEDGWKIQDNTMGYYRLFNNNDFDPPVIEIHVENQPFYTGSYVPRQPSMTLFLQDASGIDFQVGKILVTLDQESVDPGLLNIPDSTFDTKYISVGFRPELRTGEHTLKVQASDVHGNTGESEFYTFYVSSGLDIQYLGNHPNPFRVETVFAYLLTDAAEKFSLKIYTSSGRLIKVFDDPGLASADYHEIIWDGRDEWGDRIANGVYFIKLTAENQDKHKEITGKIAKLR